MSCFDRILSRGKTTTQADAPKVESETKAVSAGRDWKKIGGGVALAGFVLAVAGALAYAGLHGKLDFAGSLIKGAGSWLGSGKNGLFTGVGAVGVMFLIGVGTVVGVKVYKHVEAKRKKTTHIQNVKEKMVADQSNANKGVPVVENKKEEKKQEKTDEAASHDSTIVLPTFPQIKFENQEPQEKIKKPETEEKKIDVDNKVNVPIFPPKSNTSNQLPYSLYHTSLLFGQELND